MQKSDKWGLLILTIILASCTAATAESPPETITSPNVTLARLTNDNNSQTVDPPDIEPSTEPGERVINTESTTAVDKPNPPAEPEVVEATATDESVVTQNTLPIFDTHVHYNQNAWEQFSPDEIIGKLEQADVPRALVSSSPDDGTRMLYELDPDRIVPFLRPYYNQVTSSNWFEEATILSYLTGRLETPIYQGIGEFHLHFDGDADSAIVRETAHLAFERGIYLHVHSNAQAVDTIFGYEPEIKILWAHAGLSEPPDVVLEMLDKHPQLWVDISIREHQIAPDGKLDPAWEALFLKHPDRITIGSDTWIPSQWEHYQDIIEFDRVWLNQLPSDIARQIAYGNAVRLFEAGPHQHLE